MHIGLEAAKAGSRVHYFALEASKYEIERRIKYQKIAVEFFRRKAEGKYPDVNMNYMDWYRGELDLDLDDLELLAEREVSFEGLNIFYRNEDMFDLKAFERKFLAIKDTTDLVIVDHLHYFDTMTDNENKEVKEILKKMSDMVNRHEKPIVLVSHIRKTDKKLRQLVPDLEDFHGSSDTGKICTCAFSLAPDQINANPDTNKLQTFLTTLKCRVDGSRRGWTASVGYDIRTQRYDREYSLGKLNFTQDEFSEVGSVPFWAKNAKDPITLPTQKPLQEKYGRKK